MKDRGYSSIGLYRPKNALNVGEILRAAGCYGSALVAIEGDRFKRARTDTQDAWKHLPVVQVGSLIDAAPIGATKVAVEFIETATPLHDFLHPESAFYIFGPEDGSLPTELVKQCSHVVYIPTRHCMNLAATANVLLYDRLTKRRSP